MTGLPKSTQSALIYLSVLYEKSLPHRNGFGLSHSRQLPVSLCVFCYDCRAEPSANNAAVADHGSSGTGGPANKISGPDKNTEGPDNSNAQMSQLGINLPNVHNHTGNVASATQRKRKHSDSDDDNVLLAASSNLGGSGKR